MSLETDLNQGTILHRLLEVNNLHQSYGTIHSTQIASQYDDAKCALTGFLSYVCLRSLIFMLYHTKLKVVFLFGKQVNMGIDIKRNILEI